MSSSTRSVSSIELVLPPQNAYLYRNRPLPLPPTTLSRSPSKAKPPRPPRFSAFPKTTGPGNDPKALPQQPPVIVPKALTRQRASRMSISGATSLRERRSSQKIQQITGHDIGPVVDWTSPSSRRASISPSISPKSIRDDSSSGYSVSLDEPIFDDEPTPLADYQPRTSDSSMPPLEPDCDSVLSNQSYTAEESPKAHLDSVSLHVAKTRRLSSATSTTAAVPDMEDPFDEDLNWQAGSSYNYFSDLETADEYHRITTRLANNDKRQSICGTSSLTRSRSSLSRRLSVSARSLFTRRKDSALSASSSRASLTATNYPTKGPYSPSIPPTSDTASIVTPPRSTFETDDDDEFDGDDGSVREVIKDFFARRSEERNSVELGIPRSMPHISEQLQQPKALSKTGVHVKDLISNARDGARLIQAARGERRRTQLRTQIKMIPEEELGR
ncbi:hypothetical protein NW762_012235 [Fusarium torreyae]|uniref:Uncharacterized protein n=1 Tax=Fusarium torreyae TaxID=1237075 RepID=A0A9W8V8T9_9HYPO|nr:hypothetical protein NW762_012235 [Fusarium torreyae]